MLGRVVWKLGQPSVVVVELSRETASTRKSSRRPKDILTVTEETLPALQMATPDLTISQRMLFSIYQTTRRHILEESNSSYRRRICDSENSKSDTANKCIILKIGGDKRNHIPLTKQQMSSVLVPAWASATNTKYVDVV
jgi:hypothetical protein